MSVNYRIKQSGNIISVLVSHDSLKGVTLNRKENKPTSSKEINQYYSSQINDITIEIIPLDKGNKFEIEDYIFIEIFYKIWTEIRESITINDIIVLIQQSKGFFTVKLTEKNDFQLQNTEFDIIFNFLLSLMQYYEIQDDTHRFQLFKLCIGAFEKSNSTEIDFSPILDREKRSPFITYFIFTINNNHPLHEALKLSFLDYEQYQKDYQTLIYYIRQLDIKNPIPLYYIVQVYPQIELKSNIDKSHDVIIKNAAGFRNDSTGYNIEHNGNIVKVNIGINKSKTLQNNKEVMCKKFKMKLINEIKIIHKDVYKLKINPHLDTQNSQQCILKLQQLKAILAQLKKGISQDDLFKSDAEIPQDTCKFIKDCDIKYDENIIFNYFKALYGQNTT